MANMKKIMIIGNVGRDPESRFTADGREYTAFTVAVNERPRRAQGGDQGAAPANQDEITTWFRVTVWGRQVEFTKQYVQKGIAVFVLGNLRVSEYTGNDGQRRTSLDISADEIQLMSARGAQDAGAGGFDEGASFGGAAPSRPSASYGNRPAGGTQARPAPSPSIEEDESDMPF
jgi:single-strand DNA-binding protein